MKILGIIPARYASTRFPAKPLADIAGQSMIERVYNQVKKSKSIEKVIVATDHPQIVEHVLSFGGDVCMTSESHVSGTDRCFEVLTKQKNKFDYVINIQGDEPFIAPSQVDLLASMLDGKTELATLSKKIEDVDELLSPNVVKLVLNKDLEALYFSRSPIPHIRNIAQEKWLSNYTFYKHIGMYGYRADILAEITKLGMSSLEKSESLEQLRWLENGYCIKVAETMEETIGIDTPEDIERAIMFLSKK
ncbi:MAG: 3-deoxy-manno-octulosonate cytidylyltransferase [Bacteroidia bacterium]|nr:3-deoxy-manno-octulosonate cytidylyltransferase [Bacteroidia bacterium]